MQNIQISHNHVSTSLMSNACFSIGIAIVMMVLSGIEWYSELAVPVVMFLMIAAILSLHTIVRNVSHFDNVGLANYSVIVLILAALVVTATFADGYIIKIIEVMDYSYDDFQLHMIATFVLGQPLLAIASIVTGHYRARSNARYAIDAVDNLDEVPQGKYSCVFIGRGMRAIYNNGVFDGIIN